MAKAETIQIGDTIDVGLSKPSPRVVAGFEQWQNKNFRGDEARVIRFTDGTGITAFHGDQFTVVQWAK